MGMTATTLTGRTGSLSLPGRLGDTGALFWYAQLLAWSVYGVLHYLGATRQYDSVPWWPSFASAVAGFLLTSAMRPALDRAIGTGPVRQVVTVLGLAILFAMPFSAVSEQAYYLGEGLGWQRDRLVDVFSSSLWCGSILLTWAGVYFGVNFYAEASRQQLRAEQARSQAKEARLAVLRERLNPHFLFNTLNSISTLVLDDERERAVTMIDQLSRLLRHSIGDEPAELVTLAEELDLAGLYLDIQQTRFGERLRVDWRIEPGARRALVPPMILQPLLENAVRYAVQPSTEGAEIRVAAAMADGRLVLAVTDDGPGSAHGQAGTGVGHRNIRERLAAHYGERAAFTAGACVDGGYRAELNLPGAAPA